MTFAALRGGPAECFCGQNHNPERSEVLSFSSEGGWIAGRGFLVKQGFQRSFVVLLLAVVPFVYAQPVSFSQDIVSYPESLSQVVAVSMGRLPATIPEPTYFGTASWYSRSDRGIKKRTASGAIFDHNKRTCASWGFPLGTRLRVTNLMNGRSVICVVNDRGPAKKLKRVVDLTKKAFREIADTKHGLIQVSVVPLGKVSKRVF